MKLERCVNDESFGPAVEGCRGDFDFTEKFEKIFLSITPAAVFAVLALARIARLSRQKQQVGGPIVQFLKLVCCDSALPRSLQSFNS